MKENLEVRAYPIELRQMETANTLTGYAAVFGVPSQDLGGFIEVLDPRCFTRSLEDNADICAFWNHNSNELLGRTTSNTLSLHTDDHGLSFELQLPSTSAGNDLLELVKRHDVTGCSFGFIVRSENWTENPGQPPTRTVLDTELVEISPCVMPAYSQSTVGLRSLQAFRDHVVKDKLSWLAKIEVEEYQSEQLARKHGE